jgi:tRNA(fMet)-specific endonuclease VapC
MHLLDTDTLTHLYADHPRVTHNLRQQTDSTVGITIISNVEVLRGRFEFLLKAGSATELLRAQNLLSQTEAFLNRMFVVPLDARAATLFERLRIAKGLRKIGRADLLIACIALAHDATLVTRNLRHFQRVPKLRVTNWVD